MEIRPHRRIVIPFEPPLFTDLSAVADFAGEYYEHFGAALFGAGAMASTGINVYRRMCNSLGLKMVLDCRFSSDESVEFFSGASASADSDYIIVPSSLGAEGVSKLTTFCKPGAFVLVAVASVSECAAFSMPSVGFACPASVAASVRATGSFPLLVFDISDCSSPDSVVTAVKDGADMVIVGEPIVLAERPDRVARALAERFREFT